MNKTVNINLANILFHIDEDAYNKMRRYLEAIKRSFANTPGSDEILADIEARIAELFQEKMENERQVITQKQVDEVITIMGQPEDYMVDEDIFEDEPRPKTEPRRVKKLYRDTEQKYVAGVSSGLGHYLGIDPLWIRLLWIFLTLGSGGGFILIYGLLWILIPEASSTAQKLDMRGEAINISNIERKVKEGFEDVAEKVKSVDYEKVGNRVKSGGKTFFDTLGDIILFFFKIIAKFIGIILIIIGAATIIGLFIGLLTVGIADVVNIPGIDFYNIVNSSSVPVWLMSLFLFFAIGIPFFFLLYLGLKILVTNLKSIGNVAKFSLLGLWLISIIILIIFGIRQAAAHAYSGSTTVEDTFYVDSPTDTLNIAILSSDLIDQGRHIRIDNMHLIQNDQGEEVLLSENVRLTVKKSKDSVIRLKMRKEANGSSFNEARATAEKIQYGYLMEGNSLVLDNFLTTSRENKFKDQEVRVELFLPVGTVVNYERDNGRCWTLRADNDRGLNGCDMSEYTWQMAQDGELTCLDCPEGLNEEIDEDDENKIIINGDGIDINIEEGGESFKLKVDEDGVKLKASDKDNDKVNINIGDDGNSFKMKIEEDGTTTEKTITKN
ncbi:PspC domain-containing protein [Ulvibacterium sp.]|uniref:PspC domain-containing protein n=1 Tax=Ulvibacterium sp. TaxID=2665914 RepID=UPI003BACF138